MRRRFGRRRPSGQSARAIDPAVLGRITELGLVPVDALEPVGADDVPASLAALGAGSSEAGRHLVAFAPESGVDALLAGVALGLRLHEQEGFDGHVHAVSPRWPDEARRVLARFGSLPFSLEPLEAPVLAPGSPVTAASGTRSGVVPLDAVVRQSADPEQRGLLARVAEALGGLAAKHGAALRGYGDGVELVALARRVAVLRLDGSAVVLECAVPRRSVLRIQRDGVSDALDRLEGALRKHLQERRVREGEEGLRGRVLDTLAGDASLRSLQRWPAGGAETEIVDFVALDVAGVPYAGAVRRQLTLEGLSAILRACSALEPFLPLVLAGAEPPVRVAAPRLWVAASTVDASVRHVLGCLGDGLRGFVIGQPSAKQPSLTPADWAIASSSEAVAPPQTSAPQEERPSRPTRSRRSRSASGRRRSDASQDEPAPAAASGFEEVSLFELEEESTGSGDREARGRRRRRGRGRRGRRGDARNGGSAEAREATEAAGEEETAGERPSRRGGRRRGGSGRTTTEPPPSQEEEAPDEELTVTEEEDGSFVLLTPDVPEFDLESAPVVYEDDEDEASDVAPAPPRVDEPVKAAEAPAEPRPPRRRTAIVAHADRDSLAAAVLLARDLRMIEGIWVYPQADLMTFFRSVATDLRDDIALCVLGFTPSPARDVIQAAALYRDRISWFDHHDWPPEDRQALRTAIGEEAIFHLPGTESSLATVLGTCTRRSRFSDKLVDLAASRFTQHDYERWGRLWWWRLGEMAGRSGDHRAELEPLLAGRPSDLARAAAKAEAPPLPAEAEFAARRDFRMVHFGGYGLVVVPVPAGLDLYLAARIVRERYGARLSLAHPEGGNEELLVLGGDESGGRRGVNLRAMVEHLAGKFSFVEALSDADHVARLRVHGLHEHPQRFDELVGEIAMGRSILEG